MSKRIPVVDMILRDKDGNLLVLIRNFEPGKGKIDLIGGGVHKNESVEQAAIREAKEESGLKVRIIKKLGKFNFFERQHKMDHVFIGEIIGGKIKSSNEGEATWIHPDKIKPGNLAFPTLHLRVLRALKKEEKVSKIIKKDFPKIKNLCCSRWPGFKKWLEKGTLEYFIKNSPDYCLKYSEGKKILGLALGIEKHTCLKLEILLIEGNQRGKGIGTELLAQLEQICRKNKLKTIYLDSGEKDYTEGSFHFYVGQGFRVVGFAHIHGEKIMFFEKELL